MMQNMFFQNTIYLFILFNIIQQRQICFGAKLIIFKLSNMSEHNLLNNLQSIDFDKIIKKLQHINDKTYVQNILHHIKISNKYVMASKNNHASQSNQIFSMINFMGASSLFFTLNPTFVHHPLTVILVGQNIYLDLFYDTNMLEKNERCKQTTINPKAQAIFVHTIINVVFKYML
jgi:hypothetical protein